MNEGKFNINKVKTGSMIKYMRPGDNKIYKGKVLDILSTRTEDFYVVKHKGEKINIKVSQIADLIKEVMNEGNPTPAVQKKLIKIFQNDPLYKDVIMAKNSKQMQKAMDTLRSIRGPNAISLLKKHAKKLMGDEY